MVLGTLLNFCTSYDHVKEQHSCEDFARPMLCIGLSQITMCTQDSCHSCVRDCADSSLRLTDLQLAMEEVSWGIQPWDSGAFGVVRKLQDALGNHGHVDLMHSGLHGKKVAVKQMPNSWVASGPWEFDEQNPEAEEKPWYDLGVLWELNRLQFPYTNELLGIFRDELTTYVVTSLATEGDLFGWRAQDPKPGPEREALMVPIIMQVFSAVRSLHDLGIAHRDLSMENILLTQDTDGKTRVKIIDFAMCTLQQICRGEPRGKVVYRAPEMHTQRAYDTLTADNFSLGVVLFGTAVRDYPWSSTRPDACKSFAFVKQHGLRRLLEQRKLRKGNGERLIEVFSEPLLQLLEGLLDFEPSRRTCLGEMRAMQQNEVLSSVWDSTWFSEAEGIEKGEGDTTGVASETTGAFSEVMGTDDDEALVSSECSWNDCEDGRDSDPL